MVRLTRADDTQQSGPVKGSVEPHIAPSHRIQEVALRTRGHVVRDSSVRSLSEPRLRAFALPLCVRQLPVITLRLPRAHEAFSLCS